ncbi:MAG TPA: hypothetical protein DEH22_13670 [Chloroflexi bacterium]|nr:hypothetical protein [Chloroflexota bacterium]
MRVAPDGIENLAPTLDFFQGFLGSRDSFGGQFAGLDPGVGFFFCGLGHKNKSFNTSKLRKV